MTAARAQHMRLMLGAHRGERELSRTPVGDGAARMACDPQGEVLIAELPRNARQVGRRNSV